MSSDYESSYKHPALEIKQTPFAGRTYHTSHALVAGTCILDIATPYADTIYKQFRNEVCAECWKYDGGRRAFLTSREFGESAGLSFCDDRCKERWLGREGEEMVQLLTELETARRRKQKGKEKEEQTQTVFTTQDTERYIIDSWEAIRREFTRMKAARQWKTLQLDDFEADMARYVLIALYHYARGSLKNGASDSTNSNQSTSHLDFGMASWEDFTALQSGELQQVSKFPELVNNHIHIYQALRSRFGNLPAQESTSPARNRLAEILSTEHVRKSLGVDPGNSFGIWEVPVTEESEGLGFGVYPIPSFFNHSEPCSSSRRPQGAD